MVDGKFRKCLWESVYFAVIWTIWFKRNRIKFANTVYCRSSMVANIKFRVSEWIVCYAPSFPYSRMQVVENIQSIWSWNPKARGLLP